MPWMRCVTRRRAAGPLRLPRVTTATEQSRSSYAIMAQDFPRQSTNGFSSNSSLRKRKASEWGLPSCAPLSKRMAEAFQPKTPREAEHVFIFVCQLRANAIMMTATAKVFVIDDDQSIRKSLRRLLDASNYET